MNRFCEVCGMADMVLGDSSLYCRNCGAQSNQYIEEAFDADDAHMFNTTFVRERGTLRNAEQQQQQQLQQQQQQQQAQSQVPGNAIDEALAGLDGLAGLFGSSLQDRQNAIELTPEVFNGSAPFGVKAEDLGQPGGSQFGLEVDPTSLMSRGELASAIRKSYLNGVQKMLQLQLECLVTEFRVTPLVCGIAGPIWLRFVASTRVWENAWAEDAVMLAEHQETMKRGSRALVPPAEATEARIDVDGAEGKQKRKRVRKEPVRKERPGPRTSYGRHLSFVWLRALKERIPLSMTLAVIYLSCYIAREPILPMDIKRWATSGQLPYLAAFVEISKSAPHHIPNTVGEKQIFPMKPKLMFQPLTMPGVRSLEFQAGFVAERIGIELPPVNFHAICALFLRDLRLPVEKLLPYACRLYDWYVPSGLFLSSRKTDFPTRVYVMAMLVVVLKVLYYLDGRPQEELEEETKTDKRKDNDGFQVPRAILTRAKAKRRASEAGIDEEQSTNPRKKMDGTQTGVTTSGDDHFSVSDGQVLGNRETSQTMSGQGRGGQDGCQDVGISGNTSGLKSLNESEGFREQQKGLGHTKELLEKLESSKTTSTVDFDEELSKYLKYCQNVLFAGNECDAGMEPVVERFWGIYEKNVTKVEMQPVVNLDEEAAPDEGIARKPTPNGGTADSLERAGILETDAPSAASSMTGWRSRLGASKPTTEQKGKEKVLHTQNHELPPAPELDKESRERRDTSNLIADMKKAGFSCFPPVACDVRWDEYVRYNFQDSAAALIPVHEDYFRVVQACAKLIGIHSKALHRCVQRIEKGLLQLESNVEQFLLAEKDLDVVERAKAVKRRNPQRRRDKVGVATFRAELNKHMKDLGYL